MHVPEVHESMPSDPSPRNTAGSVVVVGPIVVVVAPGTVVVAPGTVVVAETGEITVLISLMPPVTLRLYVPGVMLNVNPTTSSGLITGACGVAETG